MRSIMATVFNTANATWDRDRGIDVGDLEFVAYEFLEVEGQSLECDGRSICKF